MRVGGQQREAGYEAPFEFDLEGVIRGVAVEVVNERIADSGEGTPAGHRSGIRRIGVGEGLIGIASARQPGSLGADVGGFQEQVPG